MFGLSFSHLILFGVIALIVLGPEQLPEVARTLGRLLNELRRATSDLGDQFTSQVDLRKPWETQAPEPPPAQVPPSSEEKKS